MIIENATKTSGSKASPRPNAPKTDPTRGGGMIGTMKDPYRGTSRGSSTPKNR